MALSVGLAAAVLVFDSQIELGVAVGVAYVVVILAAYLSHSPGLVLSSAVVCSALVVAGLVWSPPGGELDKILANRGLALAVIGIASFLSLRALRSQTEIEALNATLETEVSHRTLELREANTAMARLMGEREIFIAGISHEVRSPLSAMVSFIDLMEAAGDAISPSERDELLGTIARQASDALQLIDDLLTLTRAETGNLAVEATAVELFGEAAETVATQMAPEGTSVDVLGTPVTALADPVRVRQVLRNLLTNAYRYGGPRVRVVVGGGEDDAFVEVKDDGVGIPAEDVAKVFEAYGQAVGSNEVAGSVGLGLHLASELARLMGGELEYRRAQGWTVFRMSLPSSSSPALVGSPSGGD